MSRTVFLTIFVRGISKNISEVNRKVNIFKIICDQLPLNPQKWFCEIISHLSCRTWRENEFWENEGCSIRVLRGGEHSTSRNFIGSENYVLLLCKLFRMIREIIQRAVLLLPSPLAGLWDSCPPRISGQVETQKFEIPMQISFKIHMGAPQQPVSQKKNTLWSNTTGFYPSWSRNFVTKCIVIIAYFMRTIHIRHWASSPWGFLVKNYWKLSKTVQNEVRTPSYPRTNYILRFLF